MLSYGPLVCVRHMSFHHTHVHDDDAQYAGDTTDCPYLKMMDNDWGREGEETGPAQEAGEAKSAKKDVVMYLPVSLEDKEKCDKYNDFAIKNGLAARLMFHVTYGVFGQINGAKLLVCHTLAKKLSSYSRK